MKYLTLVIACSSLTFSACVSEPKRAPTAQQVAEGEALPPAPPVPPQSSATGSAGPATSADATGSKPAVAETLTEGQMAKVSDLANNAEVAQGKLALRKAKRAEVKSFADTMVKHHELALREQAKFMKKLNVAPADSPTSIDLKADVEKTLQALQDSDATGFDALYVKSQVESHQNALKLLDTLLIPSAKDAEVVEALRKARVVVQRHLDDARALQTK